MSMSMSMMMGAYVPVSPTPGLIEVIAYHSGIPGPLYTRADFGGQVFDVFETLIGGTYKLNIDFFKIGNSYVIGYTINGINSLGLFAYTGNWSGAVSYTGDFVLQPGDIIGIRLSSETNMGGGWDTSILTLANITADQAYVGAFGYAPGIS